MPKTERSRRDFLKKTAAAVTATSVLAAGVPRVHAAEENTIKVALVGCGGRGSGAAVNALKTAGPVTLYAAADVFQDRMDPSLGNLTRAFGDKVDLPEERRFLGFDGYKKAIDAVGPGGLVLLATPPAFRPIHLEYAVEQGVNVFMEKSFAVDAPGVRRVMAAAKKADEKNLKIACGLMWRHCPARKEAIRRIHDGELGDLISLRTYRMHGPIGMRGRTPDMLELAYQIRNYSAFTWVNGSFFLDWIVHNIDVCCWAKNAWPIDAQGMGGRQSPKTGGQMYDHYYVEYTYPDGTHLTAHGRHIQNCWGIFADLVHGTKGSGVIMQSLGAPNPRFYSGHNMTSESETWRYAGPTPNPYQVEHDLLFDAIRNDKPYNEGHRAAQAALCGILGRMAAYSGKKVTWDEALASDLILFPDLDNVTWETESPVQPDENGKYASPIPGETVVM